MAGIRARIDRNGRVVIPSEYRKALGLNLGDEVILDLEEGELRLFSLDQAIERAQELVLKYAPEGVSLADELIAERRAEAERE
jgi:AbrB family looped-hinge helix DNA binding protein